MMRAILITIVVSGIAFGQTPDSSKPNVARSAQMQAPASPQQTSPALDPHAAVIPAGTKVLLTLKQVISTKNAREGDPVYAETAFPFVTNDRILIPAGTYIQGKISGGACQARF
jgi:hypothetical protein